MFVKKYFTIFLAVLMALAAKAAYAMTGLPTMPTASAASDAPAAPASIEAVAQLVAEIGPKETFGTRALSFILKTGEQLIQEGTNFVTNFVALSKLSLWVEQQTANPEVFHQWLDIGQMLGITLISAYIVKYIAELFLFPMRRRLRRKEVHVVYLRVGAAFMRFLLILVPTIAFLGVALLTIRQSDPGKFTEAITMTVVYALTLYQLFEAVLRFMLAPRTESLRFLPLSTENAAFLKRWGKRYAEVLIFGTFLLELAVALKVPVEAISAFRSLVALTVVLMTIIVIHKKKSVISVALRGNLSAASTPHNFVENFRLWAARMWHVLAIAYLVVGYFVTMLGAEGSFWIMQRGTIGTVFTIVFMRLFLFLAARLAKKKKSMLKTGKMSRPVLRIMFQILIWVLGIVSILASWGADVYLMAASSWGQRIIGSTVSIASSLLILVAIYEGLHILIERKLHHKDDEGNIIEADARMRTLLPMLRNVMIFILVLIAGLITLSELGVDTGPLLAGAGVFGIAIGFGSQTLVKDFLTGLFILIEDTMAVGDVVKLGEHSGTIEAMTIRTVKLRDVQGALHTVPFSSISDIVNMSKDFAYALLDMDVDYSTDLDKVQEVIMRVGNELCENPEFKDDIIEPISMMGVQAFANSSITIRSRIKTVGGKQWGIKRAFQARIKPAFDKEGIEIPFPHVVHMNR